MKYKHFITLIIFLVGMFDAADAQALKGLYVDDFFNIIGNEQSENSLLNYAKLNKFNYLILYNTASIHRKKYALNTSEGSFYWRQFISKAKEKYGINKIAVVGEKAESFLPAKEYNRIVKDNLNEKIDVFNLEFEFWNKRLYESGAYYCTTYLIKQGYNCNNEGAFQFYLFQLKEMKKLKGRSDVEIETYIGNPSDAQLFEIARVVDRVLIHYYQNKIDNMASYKLNRIMVIQNKFPNLKIAPIFSSRENHLGPWLKTHRIDEVAPSFFKQLKTIKEINFNSLNFDGIIWYRYTSMPK